MGRERWSWEPEALGTLSRWDPEVERCSHRQPGKHVHQVIVAQAIQDAFCKGLNGGQYRIVVLVRDAEAEGTDDVGY